jgi:hypothetical protein
MVIHTGSSTDILYQASFTISIFLIYFLILRHILFKSEKVVEKLGLDHGFKEEKFEINIHKSDLIKICVIIIGGVIFIQSFVPLILNIYLFIQSKYNFFGTSPFSMNNFNALDFTHEIIMILIAYYLLSNYSGIANWIELKRRSPVTKSENEDEEV